MMMTMTLDLRLAALVQDLAVTALLVDLHMTVVVMIVELRLAAVIQGLLHTTLDLHQDFITLLSQVLVRLEWSRFFQRIIQLNSQVTIRVNILVNIQANIQANTHYPSYICHSQSSSPSPGHPPRAGTTYQCPYSSHDGSPSCYGPSGARRLLGIPLH